MTATQPWPPGTYITDGIRLLWVVERTGDDTLVVENSWTCEESEVAYADLASYWRVAKDDNKQSKSGSRRKTNRPRQRANAPRSDSDVS